MYSEVRTAAIHGIESVPILVEADVSEGLPQFNMVGYLGSEVKEAKDRVTTALRNSGFPLPPKRITVNLYPADIRKSGTGFDLPVALAVLSALGIIPREALEGLLVVGEVNLQGLVREVAGVLPIVTGAAAHGASRCMIPSGNREEAMCAKDIAFLPVESISEAVRFLTGVEEGAVLAGEGIGEVRENGLPDFSDISGQKVLKRACEVACAGMHNLLMIGPPGAGKSMAAKRIPSILPPLDFEERMELSKIQSVAGVFRKEESGRRPFRAPHHTISPQGMAGGGTVPRPGEISLAHNGVLFLDELTEFAPSALELLRQPMEEKEVCLVRVSGSFHYPAKFMLVAAMNPCQCGYFPDRNRCRCSERQLDRFIGRISEPILDRIDLCVETVAVSFQELSSPKKEEPSLEIRRRVMKAHEKQLERFEGLPFRYNSEIPAAGIRRFVPLGAREEKFMEDVYERMGLSARGYHKILKVARTIADLKDRPEVSLEELTEAVCYRGLDKRYWNRGDEYGRQSL